MESLDSLTWHILDAMADDWESIVQIRPHVAEFYGPTTDQQIFAILRNLHRHSLVRLMDEGGHGTDAFPNDPRTCWFDLTDAGRALWNSEGHIYRDN